MVGLSFYKFCFNKNTENIIIWNNIVHLFNQIYNIFNKFLKIYIFPCHHFNIFFNLVIPATKSAKLWNFKLIIELIVFLDKVS